MQYELAVNHVDVVPHNHAHVLCRGRGIVEIKLSFWGEILMLSKIEREQKLRQMGEIIAKIDKRTATAEDRAEFDALDEALQADKTIRSHYKTEGLRGGSTGPVTAEDRAFTDYLTRGTVSAELRAAGEATGSAGGFLVPQSFWDKLAIAMKAFGGMSQYMQQVETTDGRIMPFPTNNPTAVEASYIAENTQVPDQDYVFGNGQIYAWTVTTGAMKASLRLVQDSAVSVDDFVAARVGESIGRKLAVEAVSGAGPSSAAATGINTALASYGALSGNNGGYLGLGTATAVKLFSGTSTELLSNVLAPATAFEMIAGVDPAYWDGAAFYLNATQALNQRQVVDDNGRPLLNLENGYADGAIGSIAGFPVRVCNEIPNLAASTLGGPIFANLSHAMVQRTVTGAGLMRLTERYADFLQVGFIGYQRFDFQPVDLRAAVVIKPAAS